MVPARKARDERIRFVDGAEWRKQLDEQAYRLLGISAAQFIERYEAGEYGDPDDDPDVMWLVMLIPDDRRAT